MIVACVNVQDVWSTLLHVPIIEIGQWRLGFWHPDHVSKCTNTWQPTSTGLLETKILVECSINFGKITKQPAVQNNLLYMMYSRLFCVSQFSQFSLRSYVWGYGVFTFSRLMHYHCFAIMSKFSMKCMAGRMNYCWLFCRLYCLLFDSQDHYDFGMRAVKTVISAAGNIKREYPDMNEVRLVMCV